jgi:endonuclease-3
MGEKIFSFPFEEFFNSLREEVLKLNPPILLMKKAHKGEPFKVFVCTVLSARSRDERTAEVCERLFKRYKSFEDLAKADLKELEEILRGIGLHRQKALYLKESSKAIIEKYSGKIPNSLKELMKLKGVGRKVANIILNRIYGIPTISVDTHVHRIANRLGWVKTRTPAQTERELMKLIPREYWKEVNFLLVALGQTICKPQKPNCEICPVSKWCKKEGI